MTMAQQFAPQGFAPITVLPAMSEPSIADESNHRVANSLQLLAAMVSIEARRVADPIARAALDETTRRIAAIAGVHRQLYQARDTARVDLGAYLEDLGDALERSCGDAANGRRVLVAADSVEVSPEAAMALGVIVSELVGNACKYAYPEGAPGDVRIALIRDMPGGATLHVFDRGRGMQAGAASAGTGLGTQLVAMMAKRLGATFRWSDAAPGTRFTLQLGTC
jgi:two-component sensor histidine kinase